MPHSALPDGAQDQSRVSTGQGPSLIDRVGAVTLIWRVKCLTIRTQPMLHIRDSKQILALSMDRVKD